MEIRAKIGEDFGGRIVLGEFGDELAAGMDYAVLSPGVPVDLPLVKDMRAAGR